MPQACGVSGNACVACGQQQICQFGFCTTPSSGCKPKSCTDLGFNCGSALDGCGGTLNCGTCETSGEACGGSGTPNVCGPGSCTPKTCADLGANCGQVGDGCGTLLNCGTCTAPETCGGDGRANICAQPSCTPKTCAQLGKNCGTVSDGCTGQLECGDCTAPQTCGGAGTANVCGQGACTPKTCTELGKNCGAVDDGCGNSLNCGTCTSPLTCGGAGTPNECGATCPNGCPTGFTCNPQGSCEASGPTSLVLNVIQAPKVTVTGSIKLNGATPQLTCSSASPATVRFESTVDSHYDTQISIPCNAAFTFTADLYPSTYKVSVAGTSFSNLPDWFVVTQQSLTVTGTMSGVVLNVVQPPKVAVSGSIKLNGATPQLTCSSASPATILFESATDSHYNTQVSIPCNAAFTFSASLYPSTYKVSVAGTSFSNLPDWFVVTQTSLAISGAMSGIVLNVVQAPTVTVSGSIKLNGATPQLTCSSASPATILFESATDSHYNTQVSIPCNAAFTFTADLYPSTYKVSVAGTSFSNLPDWFVVTQSALTVSGATSGIVLNVVQAPKVTVSGSIKLNGGTPQLTCSSASPATILFESATDSHYNTQVSIPCDAAFTFTADLYPSTYKVSVAGTSFSNLPDWFVVTQQSLTITGATSGVVLNVVQAPKVTVSGSIKLNGGTPQLTCSSASPATIHFESATNSHYDTQVSISCNSAFTFTADLYPSTYKVSVAGTSFSNLPDWFVVTQTSLAISGATSGVVLNVVQAPQVAVTGTIQLNGAAPQLTCSSASPATVLFESTVDSHYDTQVSIPCSTSFAFTVNLYPSTYKVSVAGTSFSNLPGWFVTVVERIDLPPGGVAQGGAAGPVLSQIYGGGGNTGATYTNDFIELFNAGTTPVNLAGWSVQYASGTGTTWQVTPLSGTLQPGRYFLVAEGQGTGGTTPLPTADASGTINLASTSGKVALVRTSTALAGSCPVGPDVADLVGFGAADCFEGAAAAPAPSNTTAVVRATSGCADSADNAADFSAGAPAPRNSVTAANVCM